MDQRDRTERVRKIVQLAREEAARLHNEFVDTEHILLGIVRDPRSVATSLLRNLSIDPDALRAKIESLARAGNYRGPTQELPYSSAADQVFALAEREARELNHFYVGTEHLLLGVLREEKGLGAQALLAAGATLEGTREKMIALLSGDDPRLFAET